MSEAYIIDAIRTPRGKGKKDGSLYEVKPISLVVGLLKEFSVHDKFHRTLILSGFCLLKIAKISLNSSFFPKPIKRSIKFPATSIKCPTIVTGKQIGRAHV